MTDDNLRHDIKEIFNRLNTIDSTLSKLFERMSNRSELITLNKDKINSIFSELKILELDTAVIKNDQKIRNDREKLIWTLVGGIIIDLVRRSFFP